MPVAGIDVKTLSLHGTGISTFLKAVLRDVIARTPSFEWVGLGPEAALAQLPPGIRHARVELLKWLGPARLPIYDQIQLRLAVRRERLALFYSPYFDAPAGLSARTVVTMHDGVHFRFPEMYPLRLRLYYQRLMRLHGARAAAVVTDSEFSKAELVELVGIDPRRLHVVPLALAPSFRCPDRPDPTVLRRYGLPACYVLYTGGIEQRKNLKRLIEAYAVWRDRREMAPALALTGNAARYHACLADIERRGLRSSVLVTGRVVDADLAHVYAGATAVVYPSMYEGFGFPLLEAMTCRVPIACSRRASLPEIGGDAARYFDPESVEDIVVALDEVTSDAELRARLVAAGARRAADFSIRATADALARVLLEACGR